MNSLFATDNRSRLCTKTIVLTFKAFKTMTKKQREISDKEMMELIGLKPTSKSEDEDSNKRAIDLAIEEFSRNESELKPKDGEQPVESDSSVEEPDEAVTPKNDVSEQQPSASSIQRRISSKQRKLSLEEYRNTFMRPYRIEDRKPVFISGKLRQTLDRFACKIGENRMSLSGLLENIVRHHIELYADDFEHWKGM